jgi:aspartyl-tRNA(Asn)/glutamyl-tRNA(Gln) amidotransferase subunit A
VADLELCGLSVARAARALRAGELSPTELTEAYLGRIERLNPRLNAYVTVTAERARADARRATDELVAGRARGPLHGIPIGLKDLYETAGIRTTAGAKIHAEHVPAEDCSVARRLRDAGTILLGKLATHEYAYGVTTTNPHFGPTRNPWDLERIPGGSSGGSGAAIAAGLAGATMGTDTGGSIRMPASVCGVVGLKPTYGRVSKAGVIPLSYLFDHAGPITRTVEDAAIVLNIVAGYDPSDATTVRTRVPDFTAELGATDLRGVRVGVPRAYFFDRLDAEVRAGVEDAIGDLRRLGAEVREVTIAGVESGVGATFGLVLAEAQEIHAESLRTRRGDFGADVLQILENPTPDPATLMLALRARDALAVAMRRVLETVDVLVTPSTPIPAAPIGHETVQLADGEDALLLAMIRCTAPFNATGLPALSLPCGFTRGGLPIGLQIAGRPFDETMVLRVGHAYEQATDWHRRTPPLD